LAVRRAAFLVGAVVLLSLSWAFAAEKGNSKASPVDVREMGKVDYSPFLTYLKQNAESPAEYVINKFKQHDVVLLGEMHEIRENLELISSLIAPLYHKAGVRYFASEFIKSKNDALANQLVTGAEYDEELALRIFRDSPWPMWGFKEYMDVCKAIWELNSSLPPEADKVKVVCLDSDWDAAKDLPAPGSSDVEKFWLAREKHMTDVLEKDVLAKRGKALVHMGHGHTLTCKHVRPTLGHWLREKHGDRVFQICLHQELSPGRRGGLTSFLEDVMKKNGGKPVGFDVAGSPFAPLRDGSSPYFSPSPDLVLSDIALGYVFLKPVRLLSRITWVKGFIEESNFERARAAALKRGWIKEDECKTPAELDGKMAQIFEGR